MSQAGADPINTRSGGSELIDYSLKESDGKIILDRRKIQLLADRNSAYSAANGDTINFTIAPGAKDEWLDGRASFITCNLQVTGTGDLSRLYIPNGAASLFSQVQVISASGQQLVNILDYGTIQQMFVEYTSDPVWKHGAGQMYGHGSDNFGDWRPAQYHANPVYSPFTITAEAIDTVNADIMNRPAGSSLALQGGLSTGGGWNTAFRLDLAWIFNNPTLIPSQYFPLTLRCTLQNPTQSLAYVGVSDPLFPGPTGAYSTAPGNANVIAGITVSGVATGVDILVNKVKFMASLVRVAPKFHDKLVSEMSSGSFEMTVTNYYASQSTIQNNTNVANINTTFSAHDCQAFYVSLCPQPQENNLSYDYAWKWGANTITSSQLLLNGRYWPPQPNTTMVDMYHDTLAAFNTHSENVAFSPVSFSRYNGKSFVLGFLLDRDPSSSITGQSSVSSPVWSWLANFNANTPNIINVHICIAYTQCLQVNKDGTIKISQ